VGVICFYVAIAALALLWIAMHFRHLISIVRELPNSLRSLLAGLISGVTWKLDTDDMTLNMAYPLGFVVSLMSQVAIGFAIVASAINASDPTTTLGKLLRQPPAHRNYLENTTRRVLNEENAKAPDATWVDEVADEHIDSTGFTSDWLPVQVGNGGHKTVKCVVDRLTGDQVFVIGPAFREGSRTCYRVLRQARTDLYVFEDRGWDKEHRIGDTWIVETRAVDELQPIPSA